jgi:hypothetical protein
MAAQAAPGDDVLVFSNSEVVDTTSGVSGGEYEWISDAMTAAGYDVIPFDGGDGSASAWSTALTDIEVFVLPEQESGYFYNPDSPPSWLSSAAWDVLVAWIQAGGAAVMSGVCDPEDGYLLSEAVGVDYTDAFDCNGFDVADRFIDDAGLPAVLNYISAVPTMNLNTLSDAQEAPLTVWYASDTFCGVELAAGEFAAGTGRVGVLAWDWFNGGGDQAAWNSVLDSMLNGNAATSTWVEPTPPAPKTPITATTAVGERMHTVSAQGCSDDTFLFRVDPGTALAAPISDEPLDGFASQGAWDATTGTAYSLFYNFDSNDDELLTVDLETGVFTFVAEIEIPGPDDINELYSLAIGTDGTAYVFAEYYDDSADDSFFGLFVLDLDTGALTLQANVDDSDLDDPNGFAVDPTSGLFYAFEEDTWELFRVNVTTGALTLLGTLDAPSLDEDSDVTSLQIGSDGTFWVVFDVPI